MNLRTSLSQQTIFKLENKRNFAFMTYPHAECLLLNANEGMKLQN